mgnify:CR=1 FL=1
MGTTTFSDDQEGLLLCRDGCFGPLTVNSTFVGCVEAVVVASSSSSSSSSSSFVFVGAVVVASVSVGLEPRCLVGT